MSFWPHFLAIVAPLSQEKRTAVQWRSREQCNPESKLLVLARSSRSRFFASSIFSIFFFSLFTYNYSYSKTKTKEIVEEYCFYRLENRCQILARDFVAFDILPNKELLDLITKNGSSAYVYFFNRDKKDQANVIWNEIIELLYELSKSHFERYPDNRCFVFHNSGSTFLLKIPIGFREVIVFTDINASDCISFEVTITVKKN